MPVLDLQRFGFACVVPARARRIPGIRFDVKSHGWRRLCLVAVLLSAAAASLFAQAYATITGSVRDPANAVVPGAAVTVKNVDTGLQRTISTNELGYFTVGLLPPGNYELLVEKQGFQALKRSGIVLTVDQTARLDMTMRLGDISQAVTVHADAQLLQSDNAEISAVITTEQYDRLPLLQTGRIRTPASFIFLAPGAQGDVNANGTDNTAATNYIRINGGIERETEVMVEGMPAGRTQYTGSVNESAPSLDAVREFKITTSMMSAEHGRTGLAVVDFELRSGTNDFHGSAFEYLRNDRLDAREWIAATRTATRQNEFGVTLGGPVRIPKLYHGKNKTFFIFAYSGSRKRGATTTEGVQIPTPQMLVGDFSGVQTICDPATVRLDSQGRFVREPFPGNRIPTARIDPVSAKIAPYFRRPTPRAV